MKLAAACRKARMPFMWLRYDRFIGDRTPLSTPAGTPLWVPAEIYIRKQAEQAEQQTIVWNRRDGAVIWAVLVDLVLDDDYWRIKRNEQHMAFEETR